MPELQPAKRVPAPLTSPAELGQRTAYVELHCRTNYSFLVGASHPDELVQRAADLGYRALAVTDQNTLAGVVRAHQAAKECGLPLLIGTELELTDAAPLVVWIPDRAAYGRLCRLLTIGRRRAVKGKCELHFADLAEHADGLLAGVLLNDSRCTPVELMRYRQLFGDRLYALIELSRGPDDATQLERQVALAKQAGIPAVAAGDVYYHDASRQRLHDVLTAIRLKGTVAEVAGGLLPNAERYLQSTTQRAAQFRKYPELLARTLEVAARCSFSLSELRYEYPEELCPAGLSASEHLAQLTWNGAAERFRDGIPERIHKLITHELELISELQYEPYFLTVWDLVRFARSRNILCQGRGSAANSTVCYCLGVTSVDPERIDVLFERFISRERAEAPDIDIDFEHERREEVLQYIYEKYGRHRAGMTGVVITYRARSAVREVAKALGLSAERTGALAKLIGHHSLPDQEHLQKRIREAGFDPNSGVIRTLFSLVHELLGFPRHLSQHTGGMVITHGPLCELVPIENAAMPDRTVIQWDKNDLDTLGILKVDCLALGMLTAIHRAFDLVAKHHGKSYTLATVPPEQESVYDMICKADTLGVFQIESRAQMSMLPRLRPRQFYDLVIEVAIVRPGPIQGKMVHPYLRRRSGEEQVTYPTKEIEKVLEKTLGVPIFQEQAMRLAVVAAGFTPGEADQLRRAMAAWRRPGIIEPFRQKLITGMLSRGLPREFADQVFNQIRGFGEYGFPESHAASFALLVYVSCWLKHVYPAAFAAALLNSQPMGFYAPGQIIRDAREHGIEVRPVDVNCSDWDCTLEPIGGDVVALRMGFRLLSGVAQQGVEQLVQARARGRFATWRDFRRRTQLSRSALVQLARADALTSLGLDRRGGLWQALEEDAREPLFAALEDPPEPPVPLPALTLGEQVVADYQTAGLSLRAHPMSLVRSELNPLAVSTAKQLGQLRTGRRVRVAGLVLMRQRPSTAKGITFVTLEDETGVANLIVHPATWERYHLPARTATAMLVTGQLERQGEVIHVIVTRLEDLSQKLSGMQNRSRDFH